MIYPLTSATFLNTYSLIPNLPEILDNFKKSLPIGGKVHSEVTFYSANKKKFIKDLLYRVEYSNKNGKFGITFAICFCKKSYYPFSKIYTSVLTNNIEVFEECQCFYFNQKLDTINFKEIVDQLIQPSYCSINSEYTEDYIVDNLGRLIDASISTTLTNPTLLLEDNEYCKIKLSKNIFINIVDYIHKVSSPTYSFNSLYAVVYKRLIKTDLFFRSEKAILIYDILKDILG